MISNIYEEEEIVRWVFAEIMSCLREAHDPYWFRWHPGHTKIHKIMYQTFELTNVPVTRSWYRYGCFIHSDQLAGFRDFSSLKGRYLRGPLEHPRLESAVAEMGFNTQLIRDALRTTIDKMPSRMSKFMKALYENAPEDFGSVYATRLDLYQRLKYSEKVSFRDLSRFGSWLSRVRKTISAFHMAIFSHAEFMDLADTVLEFTESIEEALLKSETLLRQEKRIARRKAQLIHSFSGLFDKQVWVPIALEISARTVKGFRADEVRKTQLRKKKEKISELQNTLKYQSNALRANGLSLGWQELRDFLGRNSHKLAS